MTIKPQSRRRTVWSSITLPPSLFICCREIYRELFLFPDKTPSYNSNPWGLQRQHQLALSSRNTGRFESSSHHHGVFMLFSARSSSDWTHGPTAWVRRGEDGGETHGLWWRALGVVLHGAAGAPQPGLGAHGRAELFTPSSIRSDPSPQLIIHPRALHSAPAADVISTPALLPGVWLSPYWFINACTHQGERLGHGPSSL